MASPVPRRATTCPKPPSPSRMARVGVSTTSVICGLGFSVPAWSAATYCGTRITPCESWPRRLARMSMLAMKAASPSGTPRAAKTSRVKRSSRVDCTVGMGATLLPRMSKWEPRRIRLGVSACLLGQEVRYGGGHKRDAFLTDTLGPFVEWVPVCPEVELGLGVPRDTIRLVGEAAAPRLVVDKTGEDFTARINLQAPARPGRASR